MKRKTLKGVLLLAMVMAIMASMIIPVFANYIEYTSCPDLEPGTVVSGKNPTEWYSSTNGNYYTCYKGFKITVPSSGYITFYNYYYKSSSVWFDFYKYQNSILKGYAPYRSHLMETGTWSSSIPVSKGTYYVYPNYMDNQDKYKFKYTFTKQISDTKNYCRAYATSLAAGTKKVINVLDSYSYPRWYKINVTYKHALTITCENMMKEAGMAPDVDLISAAGNHISLNSISESQFGSTTVNPGTYYIYINPWYIGDSLCRLSWK